MTNLDTLILEIEKRKKNEINHLETALAKAKKEIEQTKETKIKEIQDHYLNEAKKILFEAINANMDTTFKTIKNEMKTFAQKPEYKETLLRMVSYAKNTLGPDIVIHCREGDRSVLGAMSVPTIGSSIDTSGGIIAEDNEGKKELDLTFEELLRTSEDRVKGFLLEKMVVEQQR